MSDKKNLRWQYEVSQPFEVQFYYLLISPLPLSAYFMPTKEVGSQVGNILIIFKKSFNKFLFYGRYLETNKDKNFIFTWN